MTDVDGTLVSSGDSISPAVAGAISHLQEQGINVGFVSGRTLPELVSMALHLGINGPIIAENGGVARLSASGELVDLGYSRQPAFEALEKLRELFPKDRMVDVVIRSQGVTPEELRRHLGGTQLLDSGYILHLMQGGVSKGKTLVRLLEKMEDGSLSPTEVMVIGDSLTDISLFELFPYSVLIINPRLPAEQREKMRELAKYVSNLPFDEGFVEVASHIVRVRGGKI